MQIIRCFVDIVLLKVYTLFVSFMATKMSFARIYHTLAVSADCMSLRIGCGLESALRQIQ